MGVVSPIFRRLQLEKYGVEWVAAPSPLAHPLDDGRVAVLSRQIRRPLRHSVAMAPDGSVLLRPFVDRHEDFFSRHPASAACAATSLADGALRPASAFVRATTLARRFADAPARALLAGNAAHSFLPLDSIASASFGLVLAVAGHAVDWPCARGGSQQIVEALAARARSRGCEIRTDVTVRSLGRHPRRRGPCSST